LTFFRAIEGVIVGFFIGAVLICIDGVDFYERVKKKILKINNLVYHKAKKKTLERKNGN